MKLPLALTVGGKVKKLFTLEWETVSENLCFVKTFLMIIKRLWLI